MTKVALCNPWFWPEVRRGSERLIHDLAVDLVALGHQPRLLTSHRARTTRTVEDGFPIVRSYRPPSLPLRVRKFQDALPHVPFTLRELMRGEDDVAVAAYPSDTLATTAWTRRTGKPSVFSYMGIPQRNVLSNVRYRMQILERATLQSTAVVALTQAARDGIWRWLGVESRVIYPGIDLSRFTPGERHPEPTIACAADPADDRKRVALLRAAFDDVRRARPTARLLLMKPADPAVEQRLSGPGVEFLDLKSEQIPDLFRSAWVSGLASYNEAFGLVLVESLACGTPVFGMNDGGVPEIINSPSVGRLFDDEDLAPALLEALELASDPSTADACRERAQAFSSLESAKRYVELFDDLGRTS